jgi:hypothetical protein
MTEPTIAPDPDELPAEEPAPELADPDESPGEAEYREDGDAEDVPDPEDDADATEPDA